LQVYDEPKDPTELKDFEFDWGPQLGAGETIVGQSFAFVDAAGATSPTQTWTGNISRIWLAGGIDGQRSIYTINVNTSGGRQFEVALGVNIVDSNRVTSDADTLRGYLAEAKIKRHDIALGKSIKEVWRDGRRVIYEGMSLASIDAYIRQLESEIAMAENVAAGTPKRSAIGTYY
jgi:gpW